MLGSEREGRAPGGKGWRLDNMHRVFISLKKPLAVAKVRLTFEGGKSAVAGAGSPRSSAEKPATSAESLPLVQRARGRSYVDYS